MFSLPKVDGLFINLARISLRWRWPIEIEQTVDDYEKVPNSISISWGYWSWGYLNWHGRRFLNLGPLEVIVWEGNEIKKVIYHSWREWKLGEHFTPDKKTYLDKFMWVNKDKMKDTVAYYSKWYGPIEVRYSQGG